jgi:hydroxysqualene dehydroxylase
MTRIHVIGAGLAGLAAAVRLHHRGHTVTLYESSGHAGGRCRSLYDPTLDRNIDNGNHLVLSGNTSIRKYLEDLDAYGGLTRAPAEFSFFDAQTSERWTLRPNAGILPWWVFAPERRPPGVSAAAFLSALKFRSAKPDDTVNETIAPTHPLYKAFWEPLAISALNTPLDRAAAALLWPVLAETFLRGADACAPMLAPDGLSAALIDPALAYFQRHDAEILFNHRLRNVQTENGAVTALQFSSDDPLDNGVRALGPTDRVILALPPAGAHSVMPELTVPEGAHAIVNAHFRLSESPHFNAPFVGLVGAAAHWAFLRGDVVSVTISAADKLAARSADEIAETLWPDVARAISAPITPCPINRVIKERRATFSQTPQNNRLRPKTTTRWSNLYLAGDWTDTGLPATIEGAVRSGHRAADCIGIPTAPISS